MESSVLSFAAAVEKRRLKGLQKTWEQNRVDRRNGYYTNIPPREISILRALGEDPVQTGEFEGVFSGYDVFVF